MRKYDHYRTIIHPLIALILPASFLISFVLLSAEQYRVAFNPPSGFMTGLSFVLPLISLVSGLTAVFLGNIFQTERVSWTARIRESMVLVLVVYTAASLFRTGPVAGRLLPSPANVLPALYAVCQWVFSVWVQKGLRDREILVMELEGKDGTTLYTALRDMGPQAEKALKALGRIRMMSVIFTLVLFFLLLPQGNNSLQLSVPTIVSVMLFFALFPFILAVCSQYSFEQFAAGAGLREEDGQRASRLRYAAVLIVLAGFTAFLVRGNSPLIPSVWILNLLRGLGNWLKRIMPNIHFSSEYEPLPEAPPSEPLNLLPMDNGSGTDLRFILDILSRMMPIMIAVLVILFLLAPLVSRKYRVMLARHSLKEFFAELRLLLRSWFGKKDGSGEDGIRLDPDNMNDVRKRLRGLAPAHADRIRRKEFGRASRAFLRLIQWGRHHDIVFTATSAPGTYAQKLAERFPDQEETLTTIANCFEQAVYSPYPLGTERLHEYEQAIREVVRKK